jgi:16S rRNA (guanine527-N7)-methyltransferase
VNDVRLVKKLSERAALARVSVTSAELSQLVKYFALLARWSARMNLTALPLDDAPDQTVDRLFIEPLAAARYVPKSPIAWIDVGSGGGSPAIPLKVLRPQARLTMVESKGRKAAFLREAVRTLELHGTEVLSDRLENLSASLGPADLVTVRAVRVDADLLSACRGALREGGALLLFQSTAVSTQVSASGFRPTHNVQLTGSPAFLEILRAI